MNLLRGILQLSNWGWIVDDRIDKSLVYRRELGAAMIRVRYTLGDGGYILRRSIVIGADRLLTDEKAEPAISEISERLEAAGISAQVEELTGFHGQGGYN